MRGKRDSGCKGLRRVLGAWCLPHRCCLWSLLFTELLARSLLHRTAIWGTFSMPSLALGTANAKLDPHAFRGSSSLCGLMREVEHKQLCPCKHK